MIRVLRSHVAGVSKASKGKDKNKRRGNVECRQSEGARKKKK